MVKWRYFEYSTGKSVFVFKKNPYPRKSLPASQKPLICTHQDPSKNGKRVTHVNVRYRDIKYTLPFVVQVWLFLTPIIYPTSIIPERFRFLAALNPTSGIIEAFRASLLPTRQVDWKLLGIGVIITLLIFLLSTVYFWKTEKEFADII